MGLNASKGNMYEFITHTWNVVKGGCPHGCRYCYMKRWGKQNPIRFDKGEMKVDLGEGRFIFVGSSCDMWAKEIDEGWIWRTLDHCRDYNNIYLFQSKNPGRFKEIGGLPREAILCTTIETNRVYRDVMGNAPYPSSRAYGMEELRGYRKYVTIEPVMDFDLEVLLQLVRVCLPEQVNIGADSGGNGLPEPSEEKIRELILGLEEFTTVKQKKNLKRLLTC